MNENRLDCETVVAADSPPDQRCSAKTVVQCWPQGHPGVGDIDWDPARLDEPVTGTDL